jgi:hypothetical protein
MCHSPLISIIQLSHEHHNRCMYHLAKCFHLCSTWQGQGLQLLCGLKMTAALHLLCVGWRNFFTGCSIVPDFWLWQEKFLVLLQYLEYNRYMMGRRNRYFEGTKDGQMTPPEYPNLNFYIKNLCILVFQMGRQTDRQTDGDIHLLHVGWRNQEPICS